MAVQQNERQPGILGRGYYVNDYILELESIGELKTVGSDKTSTHQEVWNLFQNVGFQLSEKENLGKELQYFLKEY